MANLAGDMPMRTPVIAAVALTILTALPALAQGPAVIEVHLANFKYSPQPIVMEAGKAYELRLVNDAGGGHNFAAKSFFASARLDPRDRALIRDGKIEVGGDQTRTVRFTAPAAGTYDVKCTHFLHQSFGMKGSIIVR
jgi:plastocyanin